MIILGNPLLELIALMYLRIILDWHLPFSGLMRPWCIGCVMGVVVGSKGIEFKAIKQGHWVCRAVAEN